MRIFRAKLNISESNPVVKVNNLNLDELLEAFHNFRHLTFRRINILLCNFFIQFSFVISNDGAYYLHSFNFCWPYL